MKNSGEKINNIIKLITGEKKRHFTSAVIVAAGKGSRMGDALPATKQMSLINGIPVIVHTLLAFEKSEYIDEVIVVSRAEEMSFYELFKRQYRLKKLAKAVCGGDSRRQSVLLGVNSVSEKCEYVCIHDGARCLVTEQIINDVCHSAYIYGSAIAAAPCSDTVKYSDSKFSEKTIDRDKIFLAQTPQVFKTDIYRSIAYSAERDSFPATDDAALAEQYGFKVRLVKSPSYNIKITEYTDLAIAKAIIDSRGEQLYN